MEQTRRGSGRTSAALRHAMHLAQNGSVFFVASTGEAARELVESAKRVGNELVRQNLQPIGASAPSVNVERGIVSGCRAAVFDHHVIEQRQDYLLKRIKNLQVELDSLSNQGHFL